MKKLVVLFALLLSACASSERYVQWETEKPEHFPKLIAIGYAPLSEQPGKTKSKRVLMAMQASKVAAYRELAEQVYGQQITAQTTVKDWTTESEAISSSVTGVIRGAKVVKTYVAGDFYVTELELDYHRVWELYQHRNKTQRVKRVTYF
ncbi:flagellar biosynthesis protein FlgP [Parashewanella curva]|uniref:Flagellar biosynthesis protein FlgP n=1 Tax=Parashewanella curva TaxID=2338552 RepID=A0A3L8Q1V9_9GAMM|nr:LPP20 family lipoprotein [Parashewanella curva]RLV61585.1 flagellar biosynthesis protein FlgP [Parashewanella curva]